jgi:hypothetical protein
MRLKGSKNGHALTAVGRVEVNLDLHPKGFSQSSKTCLYGPWIPLGGRPRGLEGHAELTSGHLFLERHDVGSLLEKTMCDPRDDASLVTTNYRYRTHSHRRHDANIEPSDSVEGKPYDLQQGFPLSILLTLVATFRNLRRL